MKEPRWKDAFGRVPDSFSARVEGTLNEMNRMEGRQTMLSLIHISEPTRH